MVGGVSEGRRIVIEKFGGAAFIAVIKHLLLLLLLLLLVLDVHQVYGDMS